MIKHSADGMLTEINAGIFAPPPTWNTTCSGNGSFCGGGHFREESFTKLSSSSGSTSSALPSRNTAQQVLHTRVFICIGFISPICGVQNHVSTVLRNQGSRTDSLSMLTSKNPLKQNVEQVPASLERYAPNTSGGMLRPVVNTRPVCPRAGKGDSRSRSIRRRHEQVRRMESWSAPLLLWYPSDRSSSYTSTEGGWEPNIQTFPSLLNLVFHLCGLADGADVLKSEEMAIQSSTPRGPQTRFVTPPHQDS